MPRRLHVLSLALVMACVVTAVPRLARSSAAAPPAPPLTAVQRSVADELVSVFENSTTQIRYGYVENLHDGCGFTAGRAGFCSATGDMLKVIEAYAIRRPGDPLAAYLPVLRSRAADKSASTAGLGSAFASAWRAAAQDTQFRAAQDGVVDALYFDPAASLAAAAGLKLPLAVAIFYDTAIEHGTGSDPDGLKALIARTRARAGGLPSGGVKAERRWLATFLAVRRSDLLHPHNHARRVDWPESVGRVDALARLVAEGRTGLRPPVHVNPWGDHTFTLLG